MQLEGRDDEVFESNLGVLQLFVLATVGEASKGCWNHGITELRNHGYAKRRSNGNTDLRNYGFKEIHFVGITEARNYGFTEFYNGVKTI